jgi:hypothetical protein
MRAKVTIHEQGRRAGASAVGLKTPADLAIRPDMNATAQKWTIADTAVSSRAFRRLNHVARS